jgi:DNA polymerase-3 subunit gamma/tau
MLPGDSEPPPGPSDPQEQAPLPADSGPSDDLNAPTAGPDDDPALSDLGDSSPELPGAEDEELADPAPEPAPSRTPARAHRRVAAASAPDRPYPVEPAPAPVPPPIALTIPAVPPDSESEVLMKSLPVVKSAERVPPSAEAALPAAVPRRPASSSGPLDRRGAVAASVVLICAALAAHAVAAWRRRPRYWAA